MSCNIWSANHLLHRCTNILSSLVPCASGACEAISFSINDLCGSSSSPVGPYASCACLKDQNSFAISTGLTYVVEGACGNSATDDISSVIAVFTSWCAAVAPRSAIAIATVTTSTTISISSNYFWHIVRTI